MTMIKSHYLSEERCLNVVTLDDVSNSEIKGNNFAHNLSFTLLFNQNGNFKQREKTTNQ